MTLATTFPRHPDPLRFWRSVAPERVALVDRARGGKRSYAELDAGADRWAALLRARGVGRGGIVGVLALNRVETVELLFACGRIGAALLPLNWRLAPAELAPILATARPALVAGEGRFRAAAEAADPALPWLDLDAEAPRLLAAGGPAAADVELDGEEPALVLFTSGSTGAPKGALLPHRQLLWNAVATSIAWGLGVDDVAPISTPLFHTGGWNVLALPLWHRGGRVVLLDAFEPDGFLRALREEACTTALTVPTQLVMLTECAEWGAPLPRLRGLVSGGAPCPDALAARVRAAGYGFHEGYGLTECGPNCFAITDAEAARRTGSVGWPVPFLEVRLHDDDGRPADLGELQLRGPQLFAGYLDAPEATAAAFTADGWLRTGDLAARDRSGAYRISGRRKEMYISGGENVFPAEVEAALAALPGVGEAVVVGVPDPLWGEVGRAFVVARPGTAVDGEELLRLARTLLAGYKIPRSVHVLGELPRLGSGKPDRRALATLEPVP
jgi:fatty-acyl-CoA synthase